MKYRDPLAIPARQRKAGPHRRLRLQEEREDETIDKNSYTTVPCDGCGGAIVYEIGGEIPICPQCGHNPLTGRQTKKVRPQGQSGPIPWEYFDEE